MVSDSQDRQRYGDDYRRHERIEQDVEQTSKNLGKALRRKNQVKFLLG